MLIRNGNATANKTANATKAGDDKDKPKAAAFIGVQDDKDKAKDAKPEGNASAKNSTFRAKRYVHLIPHTHNNEGWMTAPEDYFAGTEPNQIYIGGVRDILDSVISEMIENRNLTFTYAEIKYFKQWYDLQSEDVQNETKKLVKSGNLDLVSGGWSTPDEAITQYDSILDNFMMGQRFLQEEFDFHP